MEEIYWWTQASIISADGAEGTFSDSHTGGIFSGGIFRCLTKILNYTSVWSSQFEHHIKPAISIRKNC